MPWTIGVAFGLSILFRANERPWLIPLLLAQKLCYLHRIIHNVSFCILNVLANSFLEYFSLVLNTIPRKTT